MEIIKTEFEGLLIIKPRVFNDDRGFFFEGFNKNTFLKQGIDNEWVQDNQSHSVYGVVRGLHFQKPPHAQTKLVRVLQGEILDVVVDLRKNQPTFGKTHSVILSSENCLQFLVPKGFAHGFSVLSQTADVLYKCDDFYNKESESGIMYNDKDLSIDWRVPEDKMNVSEKDLILPTFKESNAGF